MTFKNETRAGVAWNAVKRRIALLFAGISTVRAARAAPSAKTAKWVGYWDDPKNVDQAITVGAILLGVVVVVLLLGAYSTRQEAKKKAGRSRRKA